MENLSVAIALLIFANVVESTVVVNRKCTKDDPRQVYPYCMLGSSKVLWCDQSNYTRLPSTNEINSHLNNKNCKSAKALYVNDSCLQDIEPVDLRPYGAIEIFHGDSNYITVLKNGTFFSNKYLKEIYLCANNISEVEQDAFSGVERMRKLRMDHNRLSENNLLFMKKLTYLEELSLNHNQIASVRHHHFRHMKHLEVISLRGNRITGIEAHAFRHLGKLRVLHLDGNLLTNIARTTFKGLRKLQMLTLSYNKIASWPETTGIFLPNLRTLNLGSNEISRLTPAHVANMSTLENLSLDNNSLEEISEDLFLSTPRLKHLDVSSNGLQDIPENAFQPLGHLKSLTLSMNRLSTLRATWFDHGIETSDTTTVVDLKGNQWVCDCEAVTFIDHLEGGPKHRSKSIAEKLQIKCFAPNYVENQILDSYLAERIRSCHNCSTESRSVIGSISSHAISSSNRALRNCNATDFLDPTKLSMKSQHASEAMAKEIFLTREPEKSHSAPAIAVNATVVLVMAGALVYILYKKRGGR